ncbi:hypothetical protein BCR43DRAFT_481897 [Syncephalastrum racemosum]|uniref:25S rRNA adenine-N(1) methyltransferase n=1 Tax=Syncephalastrum racemosum TaxID=13706 RepID=A0A1X2HSR5_SYNRA|nr:hypothetical protein BCR43DRAFT_481897 [Syncephalastrum racemosum]
MPKLKRPITQRNQPSFKHSSAETARLIRRYHVLNKELTKCDPNDARAETIRAEMESMGGIDWYQRASQLGQSKQRGGDSSKWLVQAIEKHGYRKDGLHLLDVGAVRPDNYARHGWIHAKPIDLHPQDPRIQEQDLLRMSTTTKFNIVSLSLVVNFAGDPKDRGGMLMQARRLLLPDSDTRLLFFVVPLPCITNSRYMSHEHLLAMMRSIGFSRCVEHHFSNKLAYYLFELDTKPPRKVPEWKKTMLPGKEGGKRNNFAIVLSP